MIFLPNMKYCAEHNKYQSVSIDEKYSQPFIELAQQDPKDFETLVYAKYFSDETHAKSWKKFVLRSCSSQTLSAQMRPPESCQNISDVVVNAVRSKTDKRYPDSNKNIQFLIGSCAITDT